MCLLGPPTSRGRSYNTHASQRSRGDSFTRRPRLDPRRRCSPSMSASAWRSTGWCCAPTKQARRRDSKFADQVVVGVDDIPSRWFVQRNAPGWIGVGATSHDYVLVSEHLPVHPCAGCAHPEDDPSDGTIPTIGFVSLWAGVVLTLRLLGPRRQEPALASTFGRSDLRIRGESTPSPRRRHRTAP